MGCVCFVNPPSYFIELSGAFTNPNAPHRSIACAQRHPCFDGLQFPVGS